MNGSTDYEQGKRDGRMDAIERRQDHHEARMDNHERRLIYLERIAWGMAGVLFLSAIWPRIAEILHAF